ncbi:MAG TPA: tRNA (adenosine(37)-N6)-threonylcarbamoyltransferase complex dimerization subunit type 1 TsaB [Jatrophihabitantaceae bacterium]
MLAIDTSSAALSAAVVSVNGNVLAQRMTIDARAHGELLAPSIAACLDDAGIAPHGLAAIVAGVGPGPFTGLRVGLVTAAAMADALGIPAYGVCSLDALAAAVEADSLLVATDARRREVYWARYAGGVRVEGPSVDKPAELSTVDVQAMTGAGARLYADVLGLPLLDIDYPDLASLVRVAASKIRSRAPGDALTPLYLRRPDAVVPGTAKAVTQR